MNFTLSTYLKTRQQKLQLDEDLNAMETLKFAMSLNTNTKAAFFNT